MTASPAATSSLRADAMVDSGSTGVSPRSAGMPIVPLTPASPAPEAASSHDSTSNPFKVFFMSSKLNILFVFIVPALLCRFVQVTSGSNSAALATVAFVTSFLSLVPLAAALGDLTEDVSLRCTDTIAALLNVTFGNATEVIISLVAMYAGQYELIKWTLIGSVLGNTLLVTGTAWLLGGEREKALRPRKSWTMDVDTARLMACFLTFAAGIVWVLNEAAYRASSSPCAASLSAPYISVSRAMAFVFIGCYAILVHWQLKQEEEEPAAPPIIVGEDVVMVEVTQPPPPAATGAATDASATSPGVASPAAQDSLAAPADAADPSQATTAENDDDDDDDEDEEPKFSLLFCVAGIGIVSLLISLLSDVLVDSLAATAASLGLPPLFLGIVVIPIVGNVAEHASAVLLILRGKVDLALSIAQGSSVQIILFVFPLVVLVAWPAGRPFGFVLGTDSCVLVSAVSGATAPPRPVSASVWLPLELFVVAGLSAMLLTSKAVMTLKGMLMLAAYLFIAISCAILPS